MSSIAITDIVSKMRDPETLKTVALDPSFLNPDPIFPNIIPWDDLSLSGGYPGLLLLFSTLGDEATSHQYVLKIKDSIEKKGLNNLSLFSGVSGICFALQQASCEGTRYRNMLDSLNRYLVEKVKNKFLPLLKNNIKVGKPSSPYLYDTIQGICGIGRYALENLSDPAFRYLAGEIAALSVALSHPIKYREKNILGWYVTGDDPLNSFYTKKCPNGNFNLGLAHGTPGLLAFLAIATLKGIEVDGQKEAMRTISTWICSKSIIERETIRWPATVSWEEEVEKDVPIKNTPSRDAWCYGVPGISRALFLAAKALCDDKLKTFAIDSFRGVFQRSFKEWDIPGPTICHGISGLLLITKEMANESECSDLFSRVDELKERLLSFFDPTAPFGFFDFEPTLQGNNYPVSKVGFLEGALGVILTLSTLFDPKPKWHIPLMLNV